nr:hypothetical protein Iba_chr02dCG2270 [Ipomoea batatas]
METRYNLVLPMLLLPTAEIECQSDVGWRSEAADREFSAPPEEDYDYAAADGEYGILPPRNLHARKSSGICFTEKNSGENN